MVEVGLSPLLGNRDGRSELAPAHLVHNAIGNQYGDCHAQKREKGIPGPSKGVERLPRPREGRGSEEKKRCDASSDSDDDRFGAHLFPPESEEEEPEKRTCEKAGEEVGDS